MSTRVRVLNVSSRTPTNRWALDWRRAGLCGEREGIARILVADESDATRSLLVRLFRSRGYEAVEAADGQQVLDHFGTGSFDVVLLGVRLARVDGWETCRQLCSTFHVPVLIMSANAHPTFVEWIKDCGASAFVAKPIEFESVLSWVDATCRRAPQKGDSPVTCF